MFNWLGRKSRIENEAKVLAELVLSTLGAARNNTFDEFVSIMRRSDVHELYCDSTDRKFGFSTIAPPKSLFVFDVAYTTDGPKLSGEGYQQYFGLLINANDVSIYADLNDICPLRELGVDAAALQKKTVKLSILRMYESDIRKIFNQVTY
jgi:hypothetical protein